MRPLDRSQVQSSIYSGAVQVAIPASQPGAPQPAPSPAPAPEPPRTWDDSSSSSSSTLGPSGVVLKQGHLYVRSGIRKGWKARWFTLRSDGTLCYYKGPQHEGSSGEQPLGTIKLSGMGIQSQGNEVTEAGKPFAFRLFHAAQSYEHWLAGADKEDTVRERTFCHAIVRTA